MIAPRGRRRVRSRSGGQSPGVGVERPTAGRGPFLFAGMGGASEPTPRTKTGEAASSKPTKTKPARIRRTRRSPRLPLVIERAETGDLVARSEGIIVATLTPQVENDPHRSGGSIMKIKMVSTEPAYQGRGIAQRLIRDFIWRMKQYNQTHKTPYLAIRADADSENKASQRILTKLGFHETGRTSLEAHGGDTRIHYVYILNKKYGKF